MSFLKVFMQEVRTLFSDFAIILTIIGGVLLYAFFYPQPYSKENVTSLQIGVIDNDRTTLSRDIILKLDATPSVDVKRVYMSQKDAKEAIQNKEITALVLLPKDMKKDIALKKQVVIPVGADGSYFLIYGGVLEAAMRTILTEAAGIKIANLLVKGVPLEGVKKQYTPFSLQTINLFNPQNSYTQYILPAVFILILHQTLLIGLGIFGGGVRERAYKEYDYDVPLGYTLLSRYFIFGGIFFIHLLFYLGFAFDFFEVRHLAGIGDIIAFGLVFLFATISFGVFLGSLFPVREMATPVVLFSSLPVVFSAGFVWPLEALPQTLVMISKLIPAVPAMDGFLKLNQMGASLDMISSEASILFFEGIVYLLLAVVVLKRKNS
ncbi:MAG: ABC transporter permease [Epsilonproteobacteria bacterium]|nr:ABC transporter permease [Campylobacterota bacterium]